MGQPTQRATNYTARSNIEPAQIFFHANGKSAPRSGGARDVGRGAGSHTPSTASESFSLSHSHSGIDEKRPTLKCVGRGAFRGRDLELAQLGDELLLLLRERARDLHVHLDEVRAAHVDVVELGRALRIPEGVRGSGEQYRRGAC